VTNLKTMCECEIHKKSKFQVQNIGKK